MFRVFACRCCNPIRWLAFNVIFLRIADRLTRFLFDRNAWSAFYFRSTPPPPPPLSGSELMMVDYLVDGYLEENDDHQIVILCIALSRYSSYHKHPFRRFKSPVFVTFLTWWCLGCHRLSTCCCWRTGIFLSFWDCDCDSIFQRWPRSRTPYSRYVGIIFKRIPQGSST